MIEIWRKLIVQTCFCYHIGNLVFFMNFLLNLFFWISNSVFSSLFKTVHDIGFRDRNKFIEFKINFVILIPHGFFNYVNFIVPSCYFIVAVTVYESKGNCVEWITPTTWEHENGAEDPKLTHLWTTPKIPKPFPIISFKNGIEFHFWRIIFYPNSS